MRVCSSSTPSATTPRSRACPSCTAERTTARSRWSRRDPLDERLVDLHLVDGQLARGGRATSSRCRSRRSTSLTPRSRSRVERDEAAGRVGHDAALGDLQGQRRWPGRRPGRAAGRPCRAASASSRLFGRQVDRDVQVVAGPRARRRSGAGRPRSTCRVSGRIRPVCSASGMNSSGGTMPCSGWCQRTSASAPTTAPVGGSTFGWKTTTRSLAFDGARAGRRSAPAGGGCSVVVGLVDAHAGAGRLRGVHGDVGAAQQGPRVVAVLGRQRDADAGARRRACRWPMANGCSSARGRARRRRPRRPRGVGAAAAARRTRRRRAGPRCRGRSSWRAAARRPRAAARRRCRGRARR